MVVVGVVLVEAFDVLVLNFVLSLVVSQVASYSSLCCYFYMRAPTLNTHTKKKNLHLLLE
jgi:hypothetical protein